MNRPTQPEDSVYDHLASPLKNAGQFIEAEQEELLSEERTILEGTSFKRRESRPPRRGMQLTARHISAETVMRQPAVRAGGAVAAARSV